jgi:hypothetical protein
VLLLKKCDKTRYLKGLVTTGMFWGGVAKEPGGVALYIFGCDPAPNPETAGWLMVAIVGMCLTPEWLHESDAHDFMRCALRCALQEILFFYAVLL